MGKRLVIKGADFSANGIYEPIINWYNNALLYPSGQYGVPSISGVGLLIPSKPINCLKFYFPTELTADSAIGSVIKVYKGTNGATYTGSETAIITYTITDKDFSNGYVKIAWETPIILGENEAIMAVSGELPLVSYNGGIAENIIPYLRCSGTTTIVKQTSVFVNMQYGLIIE